MTATAIAITGAAILQFATLWALFCTCRAYRELRAEADRWKRLYRWKEDQFDHLRATSHRRDLLTGRLLPLGD